MLKVDTVGSGRTASVCLVSVEIHIRYRHGLLGLERLVRWAFQEWLADIKRYQLPGLLSGIGPMRSLLQFSKLQENM